jgi:hypothetical protein
MHNPAQMMPSRPEYPSCHSGSDLPSNVAFNDRYAYFVHLGQYHAVRFTSPSVRGNRSFFYQGGDDGHLRW